MQSLSPELRKRLFGVQQDELTSESVYRHIAGVVKNKHNRDILTRIADQELIHAGIWQRYTQREARPNKWKVWIYVLFIRLWGLTFGVKLMERSERRAALNYDELATHIPEAKEIQKEEQEHEDRLIDMIKDKTLDYLGSVVLGLNDALVELTGVLAGLTLGLQNSRMIAFVGIITGIAAAFSMAGSEYLSSKTEETGTNPVTASLYTGLAYIGTVFALILPYLFISNIYLALTSTVAIAILIIAAFNFYAAVAKGYSFKSRFFEMVAISLSVTVISFFVGYLIKRLFGIEA